MAATHLLTAEVVSVFIFVVIYTEKHAVCLKDYRIQSFLSIRYVHGDLCKHIEIYSSTDREGMTFLLISCKLPTFKS